VLLVYADGITYPFMLSPFDVIIGNVAIGDLDTGRESFRDSGGMKRKGRSPV